MSNLIIHHHEQTTLAIDPTDEMVNASLLVKRFGGRNPIEYLASSETLPALTRIAENNGQPLASHWKDSRLRTSSRLDFLREITTAGIIRRVPGTVGGHKAAAPGIAGNGLRNFAPGLWVHRDLAVDLARWAECRGESWRPSPLANFIEKVLNQALSGDKA